jgi:hypothetical protein
MASRKGVSKRGLAQDEKDLLSSLQLSYEELARYCLDLKLNFEHVHHYQMAQVRNEATRAREHAEAVTALLMHIRNNGKMPKNWRKLTIPELVGFANALPSVEHLSNLEETPWISRSEAAFICQMGVFAESQTDDTPISESDLNRVKKCLDIREGAFLTLLRKSKAMLKLHEQC